MNARLWWTDADQAELDLLTWQLVDAAFQHRDNCPDCSPAYWCHAMREAFDTLLEWRAGRTLRSKAAWLRERETNREAACAI